ncbi:Hypothetical protein, putative [Bodo saltans]|uniref:Uncharacterized protein n=1 Tax=Bodo saltans TaxID=75058 RepID=A0A0S4JG83_BODSA|nr:Hypothetical protein, putative [Bodo saltans]|eukprot:CUG89328.1 Hypothetical protein, putative [Bodo saltans]
MNVFKITIEHVQAQEKEYGYHLQLRVGLQQKQETGKQSGRRGGAPTFIPFALWGSNTGAPPPWWNAETCSMEVQPTSGIEWDIGNASNSDYIELPAKGDGTNINSKCQQTIEFQLCKVKVPHDSAMRSSYAKKRATTVYVGKVDVGAVTTGNDVTTTTLVFGETATVTVLVHRLGVIDASAVVPAVQRSISENITMKPPILTLDEVAAAMSARASQALEGSNVHRLLSEWSGALQAVGGQLAPLLATLPFGDLIATAAAGLFAAVMGRGAVLELGADLCGQTVLVLRVLLQPLVREMIIADESTHSLLEQLLAVMEDNVRILDEYNASGTVAQLLKVSSRLDALQQQSAEMHRIFTLMHQLTSFRAQGSHADDMQMLEIVGSTQLLTADSLCEHLLPQLLERLDNVATSTDTAGAP